VEIYDELEDSSQESEGGNYSVMPSSIDSAFRNSYCHQALQAQDFVDSAPGRTKKIETFS
jgi:hypothetical protein